MSSFGGGGWRSRIFPVLFFAALVVAWAPDAVLGQGVFWAHDLRHHHLPWRVWSAGAWAAGHVPLWSPEVGLGFPLMADGQTGVFYAPTQLLFVLLPPLDALNWSLLLHIFWAALGAWALARALGRGEAASLLAGTAYGFSGFLVSHAHYLGFQNAAAWLPWLLWAVQRRAFAFAGLCTFCLLVAGHPQVAALALLLGGGFALHTRGLRPFLGAAALGALAAGPQLVATAELLRFSLRDGGLPDVLANTGSLPLPELLGAVWPRFFGYERPADISQTYYHRGAGYWGGGESFWEMCFYPGIAVLALAVLALRRERFWTGVAGISLLLMLGEHTPLWSVVRRLPGLEGFRFPARFGLTLTLALDLLAAAGLDRILQADAGLRRRAALGGLVLALGLGVGLGLAHGLVEGIEQPLRSALTGHFQARMVSPAPPPLSALAQAALPPPEIWTSSEVSRRVESVLVGLRAGTALSLASAWPSLVLGLLAGALFLKTRRRPLPAIILGVLIVDLFAFGRGFQATFSREEAERQPLALSAIAAEGGRYRSTVVDRRQDPALDVELMSASLGLLYGTRDVILPSPLRIVRNEAFLARTGLDVGDRGPQKVARLLANRPLVDLMGLRWLLSVHEISGPKLVTVQSDPVRLVRNDDALPGAFWVGCATPVADAEAALAALGDLDPRREAIVEGGPTGLPACTGLGEPVSVGSAEIRTESPDQLVIAVAAEAPGLLVQNDTLYPGWSATLDGQPAPLLRADFLFRGVEVPAGAHEVVLRYRPRGVWAALYVAPLGLLGLGLWALLARRRRD